MSYSRRNFIKAAGVNTLTGLLLNNVSMADTPKYTLNNKTLKVGLIGCGGRGTAAAIEAINADPNVILHAMADAFADHLDVSHKSLTAELGNKVKVAEKNKFVGLDAYQKLLATDVDVIIL